MPVATIGPVDTYYERRGDGPPLVLLHGACMVLEGWEGQIDALSRQFTVVSPERRGIGRTPDYDGLWTYQGMADDTGAFMDALGIRKAYVVGFSDGGNIGLLLAIRRPDLVARLAVSGANASAEALGEFGHAVEKMSPEELLESAPPQVQEWLAIHRRVAPDRGESLLASKPRAALAASPGSTPSPGQPKGQVEGEALPVLSTSER